MRKLIMTGLLAAGMFAGKAQSVDSLFFNLYTDSLKKGFYNYISVDGKLSDGTYAPLDTSKVLLLSNEGFFSGNDLFIDSSFTGHAVKVKAILKSNPSIRKETLIHIRKRGFDEPLKTDEEIMGGQNPARKRKRS
jgi:hypothetical protein